MQVNLPLRSFSFFKLILGVLLLTLSLFFPITSFIFLIILIFGRAHSLGAWLSMWAAKKLNWFFVFWIIFIILVVSFLGVKVLSIKTLSLTGYFLFLVHFLYDEFDLQEGVKNLSNNIASLGLSLLVSIFLIRDFFSVNLDLLFFVSVLLVFLSLEFVFLREISWFFINTKIFYLFLLFSFIKNTSSFSLFCVMLIYHYIFWFVYPVYKLHKYKREERDGLIMMLLILSVLFVFVYSYSFWDGSIYGDISNRLFYIVTIIHVLTTAPFGYLFGLSKPKYHVS